MWPGQLILIIIYFAENAPRNNSAAFRNSTVLLRSDLHEHWRSNSISRLIGTPSRETSRAGKPHRSNLRGSVTRYQRHWINYNTRRGQTWKHDWHSLAESPKEKKEQEVLKCNQDNRRKVQTHIRYLLFSESRRDMYSLQSQ